MKRIFIILSIILSSTFANAQIGIGLRDNNYIYSYYKINDKWEVKYEHSVFAEKFGFQYFRVNASYIFNKKNFMLKLTPYYGQIYNAGFYNCGIGAMSNLLLKNWFNFYIQLNPHYDSGYDYNTCCKVGVGFKVHRDLLVVAAYSNIPEYRKTDDRLRMGLIFKSGNLRVKPILSIPLVKPKSIRILTSIDYLF